MNKRSRPPATTSPAELLERWLPAEMQRLGNASGLPEMVVRLHLTGEGGGTWDLCCREGQLMVRPGSGQGPARVSLGLTVADFMALVAGEPGPVDLAPPSSSPSDLLFLDAASQQLVRDVRGSFRFEVHGYNRRTWVLDAALGQPLDPGADPDVVIATDAATYGAVLARELSPPEAYLEGKIRVTGDAALGMQVGIALLPKF